MKFVLKPYLYPAWKPILGSFALIVLQAASIVPVAILVQKIFDHVLTQRDVGTLHSILALTLILLIINGAAAVSNRYLALRAVKSSVHRIRHDLLERVLNMSTLDYANSNPDLIHSQIVHDSERIDCMISALLTQFIPSILVAIGLSFVLVYLSPRLALATAIVAPLLLLVGKSIGRVAETWTRKFHKDFSTFSEGVLFVLHFLNFIKHSSAESYELDRQTKNITSLRDSSHRMAWLTTAYMIIQGNVVLLGGIAVLFVGGAQVMNGTLSVGSLLSFYIALSFLVTYLRMATSSIVVMVEGFASLESIKPLLKMPPLTVEGAIFQGLHSHLEFADVSFSYESGFSLKEINFKINRGEIVGIYGASGVGKSTLMNLALGLYRPHRGSISVDGTDVAVLNSSSYRARIGVLSQSAHIFDGTIRENIVYGLSDVSEEKLDRVVKVSQLDDFIGTLKKGYDTKVGPRGALLSGGQRQRVAIARALLRAPDLLILDEPDNNLDVATVGRMLLNIKKAGITTLVITHQSELKGYFDTVYELSGSTIVKLSQQHA